MLPSSNRKPVVVGIGGPVGSGKSTLALTLCQRFRDQCELGVITNDIYTQEDAAMLIRNAALPPDRIIGVETGGCPHTAIRDDISMNLDAIARLSERFPQLDVILLESGGDNLTATFSPELVDLFIYVIDVTEGDDIPRKGGPAIAQSDLLLINKATLAPYVGADLERMDRDTKSQRPKKPYIFTDLRHDQGIAELIAWFEHQALFAGVA